MSIWQDKSTGAHLDELCKLSLKRQFEVRRLEYECREHDHTFSEADLTANRCFSRSFKCFYLYYDGGRLAGFLQLFAPTKDEAEITGFVDPILRGNGIFKRMFTYASLELQKYKIENACFVLEPGSPDANEVAKHLKLENDRSELLMLLDDAKYQEWQDGYAAASVLKVSNDRTVSVPMETDGSEREFALKSEYEPGNRTITVRIEDDRHGCIGRISAEYDETASGGTVFIYGFEVEEDYRNRGIGKLIMNEMVREACVRFPDAKLKLQVSTLSAAACHIYEQMGFLTESRLDYYIAESN